MTKDNPESACNPPESGKKQKPEENPGFIAGQWKPGESGNPAGKKKGTLNSQTILKHLLGLKSNLPNPIDGKSLNVLEHIMAKVIAKGMKGDLSAAKLILERYEGMAIQPYIDKTTDYDSMDKEALKKKAAELTKKIAEKTQEKDEAE